MNSKEKLNVPKRPGVYVLVININKDVNVKIGKLGSFTFPKGLYVYVGSARGKHSTSLKWRILRHIRPNKRLKWHIDYLLVEKPVELKDVVFAVTESNYECDIVRELISTNCFKIQVRNFGSSDCRCPAHLLRYVAPGNKEELVSIIKKVFVSLKLRPKVLPIPSS
ncbi:MAG: GIY-YIG nuclease family protein [Thermoprotei archaeon]|nr:MAG: GIY-YIG nuclease family protein [Thermoprotei archaeon]